MEINFQHFINYVINQKPTLTLFHLKDGNKVGIYTPIPWNNNANWKNIWIHLLLI